MNHDIKPTIVFDNQVIDLEKEFDQVTELYREMVMFFTKNTILQMTNMGLMCDIMDIHRELIEGVHTRFLLNQSYKIVDEFKDMVKKYEDSGLKEEIQRMAKLITEKCVQLQ